jgi:hypothetical protein
MEIKGTAIISLQEFVKKNFRERFDEWLISLPEASRKIMDGAILVNSWYPIQDAVIEPTKKMCDLFYHGDVKGAWEAGRFSAEHALKGIYKVFVKIGSPEFIIDKSSRILPTYYKMSEMEVVITKPKSSILRITKFPTPNTYLEYRIGGWMEKALEISGCEGITIRITKSMANGDPVTEYLSEWE